MLFDWLRLRFEFVAIERVEFPLVMAANVLRGALGVLSRKIACAPGCPGDCLYAQVFEAAPTRPVPSGLADPPKPFVFRARHLDGKSFEAGEAFRFEVNLFSIDPGVADHLRRAFAALREHGLGPTRGRVALRKMDADTQLVDLAAIHECADLRVEFVTPTELKVAGKLADQPDFPALFGRVRDRVSTLRALYGAGPLEMDFRGPAERSKLVRMTACDLLRPEPASRYSSRTKQTHFLGGFTGSATYQGELAEFVPWLRAAQATGVGRQCVWGKGEIRVLDI